MSARWTAGHQLKSHVMDWAETRAIWLTPEQAETWALFDDNPENRAAFVAQCAVWREEYARAVPGLRAALRALDALEEQPARRILDLHQREADREVHWGCAGCGAYSDFAIEWPCDTVLAIADHYGIEAEWDFLPLRRPQDATLEVLDVAAKALGLDG